MRLPLGFLSFGIAELYCITSGDGDRFVKRQLAALEAAGMPNNVDGSTPATWNYLDFAAMDLRMCLNHAIRFIFCPSARSLVSNCALTPVRIELLAACLYSRPLNL